MISFDKFSNTARPIPLLCSDSSDDDLVTPDFGKRVSFQNLVNSQTLTWYHYLILAFVAATSCCIQVQTYLPLILIPKLSCIWNLSTHEMSILAISFSLFMFLTPLLQSVLSQFSLKIRLTLMLSIAMTLLIVSIFSTRIEHIVLIRALAGMLLIPQSLLTKLWVHIYPVKFHAGCRTIISLAKTLGLIVGIVVPLLFYQSANFKYIMLACSLCFIVPVCLSWWVVYTPLMLLAKGKYSFIMGSLNTIFRGSDVEFIRLQEIDFSDVSRRIPWDPTYLFNEKTNRNNRNLLFLYKFASGALTAAILCTTHLLYTSNDKCWVLKWNRCFNESSEPVAQPSLKNGYLYIALSSLLTLAAVDYVRFHKLKYKLMLLSITCSVTTALYSVCLHQKGVTFVLVALIMSSHRALEDTITLINSTVSVSIAGECAINFAFTVGMITNKLLFDQMTWLPMVTAGVLMLGVFGTAFVQELPATKDICNMVEMDEPLEKVEFEMEVVDDETGNSIYTDSDVDDEISE